MYVGLYGPKLNSSDNSAVYKFFRNLGARRETWSTFLAEDTQLLGTTAQTLVAMATWCPLFVYPCNNLHCESPALEFV